MSAACPCGSGKAYADCCQPFHKGPGWPDSPEALMRSRYSAFALRMEDYLRQSWHPETLPKGQLCQPDIQWMSLDILATGQAPTSEIVSDVNAPETTGYVRFRAVYRSGGNGEQQNPSSSVRWMQLEEESRFCKYDSRWVYLDGDAKWTELKLGRNALCLCGSGKKFKRCCG